LTIDVRDSLASSVAIKSRTHPRHAAKGVGRRPSSGIATTTFARADIAAPNHERTGSGDVGSNAFTT
jgi:hypothetical protein